VHGDQSDDTFWKCFLVDYGKDWDIIIDDGSHFNSHIIKTFGHLWPVLKAGGFYAIEDLGVSYGSDPYFLQPGYPNHMDWLKLKVHEMNHGSEIDSIYFSKELAVIKKAL
jgi:hypothetical protein